MDKIRHTLCPILAAFIWGTAFVYQDMGSEYLGAFSFNFARSVVATVFLFVLSIAVDLFTISRQKKAGTYEPLSKEEHQKEVKTTLLAGLICGTVLAVPAVLQQQGIAMSGAAKSGFLTALYVVLVPVAGMFLKKKVPLRVWVAVVISVAGLYFICIQPGTDMSVSAGDWFLLACALMFTIQILTIDHFSARIDGIKLSCLQFAVVSLETGIGTLLFEDTHVADYRAALIPILFCGLLSSGVAYTLQIISQKGANPTIVSILMSLESVFATLAAAMILHQILTGREYLGCVLMFIAVLLAQVPVELLLKKRDPKEEGAE